MFPDRMCLNCKHTELEFCMKCVCVLGGVCQESVWCMKNDTGVVRVCLDGLTQGHLGISAEFITVNVTDLIRD